MARTSLLPLRERISARLAQLWMSVVLAGFVVIRVLLSSSGHKLWSWWRAH